MEGKLIPIDKAFSKGLIAGKSNYKNPPNSAQTIKNVRIINQSLTVKNGWTELFIDGAAIPANAIVGNQKLMIAQNKKLWEFDGTSLTDKGSIGNSSTFNFIKHGNYTIILNGVSAPYVYDGTTLSAVTTIPASVYPLFGEKFANMTVIAGSGTKQNTIYFSDAITNINPEYSYKWTDTATTTITFGSNVLGLHATLSYLWIFTENRIEYVAKTQIATTGEIEYVYSLPLGRGSQLASPNSVCSAGDKVFYLGKDNKIRTMNYKVGIVDPQIADLSDVALGGIDQYIQDTLNPDQSKCVSVFDRTRNLIKFFVRTKTSAVNDICIIYDIVNETWLIDDNKRFSYVCERKDGYYAVGSFVNQIIQDELGSTDDLDYISWEYKTTPLGFGNNNIKKQFRGLQFNGMINAVTNIYFDIIVDGNIVKSGVVDGSTKAGTNLLGIGSSPVGGQAIGGDIYDVTNTLFPYSMVITKGNLRVRGKIIWVRFYGDDSPTPNFTLDNLSFVVMGTEAYNLDDKQI